MFRFVLPVLVGAVAMVVATAVKKRTPDAPTQGGFAVPTQVDRRDFPDADTPWLVVVFSSATCDTCAEVVAKAQVLSSTDVAVVDVEYGRDNALHKRYAIEAVPTLLIVDKEGIVRHSIMGPVKAQDLWAAVAECRDPGSTPGINCAQ